jgi:opacity protein-like surface antigen
MTNKTKTICCAVALLATTAATPALSQSKNFAGPSIAVSVSGIGSETNISIPEDDVNFGSTGATDIVYGLDLSYSAPIDNKFLISFGGNYDLNKQDAGNLVGVVTLKVKERYSLYVAPTFLISDNSALFIKGSYNKMKAEATADGESDSSNFSGYGYGAGIKMLFDKNLYAQAELQIVDYDTKTDDGVKFDSKTTAGIISIGYKF